DCAVGPHTVLPGQTKSDLAWPMLHLYKTADPDQGAELARPLPSSAVRRGSLYVLATEGTGQASVLDEPTPPLLPTVSTRNNPARWAGFHPRPDWPTPTAMPAVAAHPPRAGYRGPLTDCKPQPRARPAPRRRRPCGLRFALSLILRILAASSPAQLSCQQLIGSSQGRAWPSRYHPADQGRFGNGDIGG